MLDITRERVLRHMADNIDEAVLSTFEALEELEEAHDKAGAIGSMEDTYAWQKDVRDVMTLLSKDVQHMSSWLMVIGRKHGARYWNHGVEHSERLEKLAKRLDLSIVTEVEP